MRAQQNCQGGESTRTRQLETLLRFGGEGGFPGGRTARWQRIGTYSRAALNRSYNRRFVKTVDVGKRRKNLLAAHAVDHSLLPRVEDCMRKNRKIAKHP